MKKATEGTLKVPNVDPTQGETKDKHYNGTLTMPEAKNGHAWICLLTLVSDDGCMMNIDKTEKPWLDQYEHGHDISQGANAWPGVFVSGKTYDIEIHYSQVWYKPDIDDFDGISVILCLLPIEIEQNEYMPEDGIRFCRWLDAFPDGRVFDNKFAEKDRDKFRIKIPGIVPNLTKAKIKSTEIHGAMIGGAFVNKTTDGDYEIQMNAENGVTHSTPILLVSDGDDDKTYNGKGRDDKDNDQTLLADFNSKIIVTFPELNSTQVEFKASKPKGEIKVNVLYLSLDGTIPKDKRETLELIHIL